ncbi:signal peptidase I [Bacteroides sp. 224]|uniref:signal peptidase I n=1 Tax=Bacteroides sp. 224 TaxID=2302936 RepID=UPI0013D7927F|nr:signal peptidase I [Bacteroides sp. 224]NDV65514.1 signal peptidase I [Bacteroides sp. 224]
MAINNKKSVLKQRLKHLMQWLLFLTIAIALAISLRLFLFAKFSIPTPSMEPAIKAGDQVIVSKLTPGARIITNFFSMKNSEEAQLKRTPGFAIKRNDVLIFNFPYSEWHRITIDMNLFYAKRCVAIPGDTFYIENGIYKVKHSIDTLGCYENQQHLSGRKESDFDPAVYHCFPHDEHYSWNIKNFGPLYIPQKEDDLSIDTRNIVLYKNLIEYETRKAISTKDEQVFMADSLITTYKFTKNYYFMAGDYVFDSKDSRYWGLLPEDHIVGKVAFVWNTKNKETGKVSWDRFLKRVN